MMAAFQTTVSREHMERQLEQSKEQQIPMKAVIDDLDSSIFNLIWEVRDLTDSVSLSDSQKVTEIKSLLDQGKNQCVRASEK